jgi:hypothetical protein
MSEETTRSINGGDSFETRVLAEFAKLNSRMDSFGGRLASLEEKVDARLHDTRPIWEAVLARLEKIETKLDVLGLDLLDTRADVDLLKKRVPPAA